MDNKATDFTTPENIKVRPGIHTFLVEKDGFIATEDRKEFLVDNKFNKQITFVLKKNYEIVDQIIKTHFSVPNLYCEPLEPFLSS